MDLEMSLLKKGDSDIRMNNVRTRMGLYVRHRHF